jgi:hypothetical protein
VTEPTDEQTGTFPAPIRIDGYFAWTWRLFRACFLRLIAVFLGGAAAAGLLYISLVLVMVYGFEAAASVEALAVAFAAQVLLSTVAGSMVAAIAAPVFVEQVTGTRVGGDAGWRRVRPRFGHVVVSALYTAMPLLVLVLFLGQITHFVMLPALLGPPIVVQAIVWEQLEFREAATRAKNLLAGGWGRVLSALLALALGPALVQILVLPLVGELLPDASDTNLAGSLWATALIAVTSAPVWLFTAAAGTVAYLDLRARFEDLDDAGLASEAERLSEAPREAPSPG